MWWRFLIKETEFGRYMTTLICLQILKELFFANYLVKKIIQLYYEYFTFQRSQRKQFNK